VTLAARTPRAPRRAPADLTFSIDEALIESWAADEPDWLSSLICRLASSMV